MPNIIFKIDLKQDAQNWVRIIQQTKHTFGRPKSDMLFGVPKDLVKKVAKMPKDKASNYVYRYLMQKRPNFIKGLKTNKGLLEFYFNEKGIGLFSAIAGITSKPIYTGTFHCTFTLMTSCPYDTRYHWFMVAAKRPMPSQITNICHEILHLQFLYYYRDYCLERGLSEKQLDDLKEAITFMLNDKSFEEFYLAQDFGYPNHQQLRQVLEKIWKKDKNFQRFLDKAIKVMKNQR